MVFLQSIAPLASTPWAPGQDIGLARDFSDVVDSYAESRPPVLLADASPRSGTTLHQKTSEDVCSFSTRDFASCINALSEGSDDAPRTFWHPNFVSNELLQNEVAARMNSKGGAYIGVGPYQNYTFIARTQPTVAIIIDIRRNNILQHLLMKALMAESSSREEFLTKLLMRRPAAHSLAGQPTDELLDALEHQEQLTRIEVQQRIHDVCEKIEREFGFRLNAEDKMVIENYWTAFQNCGFNLRYDGCGDGWDEIKTGSHRPDPTWRDIILVGGPAANFHWLANEANFQTIKRMHAEGRIIPVQGDFSGEKTFRRVGVLLRARHLTVSYFYTSNVELWLHKERTSGALARFYENVARLPVDEKSQMIRVVHSPKPKQDFVGDHRSKYPMGFVPIQRYLRVWEKRDLNKVSAPDYLDAGLPTR